MKRLGVLILNYYSYEETLRYVSNLKQQQQVSLTILIIDNCSPNDAYQKLALAFKDDPVTTVLQSSRNGGYAYGNNFGLRILLAKDLDFILVSNNDIELESPDLLFRLAITYEQLNSPGLIAPKMLVKDKEDQKHQAWKLPGIKDSLLLSLRITYRVAHWLGGTNAYRFNTDDTGIHPVDCLSGAFFLGSRKVLQSLYPWDENTFLYCEESILGQEIKKRGLANYLVRSLSYHHRHGATTTRLHTFIRLRFFWLQSTLYYHRKYHGSGIAVRLALFLLFLLWIPESLLIRGLRRVTRPQRS